MVREPAIAHREPERATGPAVPDLGVDRGVAAPIASAAGMFHVVAQGAGTPSEEAPEDTADRAHGVAAAVAPPACRLEGVVEALAAGGAVAAGADNR